MSVEQFKRVSKSSYATTPDVLIIENDAHVAGIVDLLLKHEDYSTRLIRDGQSASQYINYRNPTKLVIVDLELPYADGYSVLKRIRSNKKWQHVPVVIISKKATEKDIVKCFDLGASDYILRPFLPEELVARINRLIQVAA